MTGLVKNNKHKLSQSIFKDSLIMNAIKNTFSPDWGVVTCDIAFCDYTLKGSNDDFEELNITLKITNGDNGITDELKYTIESADDGELIIFLDSLTTKGSRPSNTEPEIESVDDYLDGLTDTIADALYSQLSFLGLTDTSKITIIGSCEEETTSEEDRFCGALEVSICEAGERISDDDSISEAMVNVSLIVLSPNHKINASAKIDLPNTKITSKDFLNGNLPNYGDVVLESEVYQYVESIHSEDDFIDGDIIERIEAHPEYTFKSMSIDNFDLDEHYVDNAKVDEFSKMASESNYYPPIVVGLVDGEYTIIDGIHRLNALHFNNETTVNAFVGE